MIPIFWRASEKEAQETIEQLGLRMAWPFPVSDVPGGIVKL
jgi:hypothetical protein